MDNTRIRRYYRPSGFGLNAMAYRLIAADDDLRCHFHFNSLCGIITVVIGLCALLIITCSILSMNSVSTNKIVFQDLKKDAEKKLPRRESVLYIRPAYDCIHKHLKQTDVFQEKTKRTLWKEHLEVEIMNSRISCITKLLKPERSSPK